MVSFQDTLVFRMPEDGASLTLRGFVACLKGVTLAVTKQFATYYDRQMRMYVRCHSYRYIGFVPGRNLLLKYHNRHANPDDYIHRVYDPTTGRQTLYEVLQRYQFPTFPEVLNELEYIAREL